MTPLLSYLAAAALLLSPPADIDAEDLHATLIPTVRALALHLEILDPRELHHMLRDEQDFAADLNCLRERYRELWAAPPLAEAERFPGREVVNDLLAFNLAYRQDLEKRLELDTVHAEEIRAAIIETAQLYRAWDLVRDARTTYFYITVRRQALLSLRQTLGDVAFYRGDLPPAVPVWRLTPAP